MGGGGVFDWSRLGLEIGTSGVVRRRTLEGKVEDLKRRREESRTSVGVSSRGLDSDVSLYSQKDSYRRSNLLDES